MEEPTNWVITCFCGQKLEGETEVELLSRARNHIDEAHPEREKLSDEQLMERAEKQPAG